MKGMREALDLHEQSRQYIIEQAKSAAPAFAELVRGDHARAHSNDEWALENPDEILICDGEIEFKRWHQSGDMYFCIPTDYLLDPQGWAERYREQRLRQEAEAAERRRREKEERREQERQTLRRLLAKYPEER